MTSRLITFKLFEERLRDRKQRAAAAILKLPLYKTLDNSTQPRGPGPHPSDEVAPVAKCLLGNLKDGSILCTLCSFACTRISSGFGKNVCSIAGKLKKTRFFKFWVSISLQRTSLSTNSVSQSK